MKNQSAKMVDPTQNFDVFMDDTEINENEEMEIEFTQVETRKKTRSPSPTKTTPSVATTNHYDILSDEEEDPKENGTEASLTQKKPRTKSKSPGRHHRSKSPKPRKEKKKKSKDNELEDYLLAESIQQNSDLLKKKKHHKKSIASFFGAQEKDKKKNEEATDDPVLEACASTLNDVTMNMATTTDSPDTDPNGHPQATATTQDVATEQSLSDSEQEKDNWEENSQGEDDNEGSQKDLETEATDDALDLKSISDTNMDEGEQYPHIERGVQGIFGRKRLNKHVKRTSKRHSVSFQSGRASEADPGRPSTDRNQESRTHYTPMDNANRDRYPVRTNPGGPPQDTQEYPNNDMPELYRISIRFGKTTKEMNSATPHTEHLMNFLDLWSSLDSEIYPVFNNGIHKGKLCPPNMFPKRPNEIKNLMHIVYSKRGNSTCLQISVTIAGHLQFWNLQKDMSLTPEFRQQEITVKKIHMDINHEATIGFLTETQSAFHYRDAIEADARATFKIGAHIPISVQERRFSLSPPGTVPSKQQSTTGLVLITDIKNVEEAKTLCEIYGFDNELIKKRVFMPKNSRIIPCKPDQSLDPEVHTKLLKLHAHKMKQLSQVKLHQITTESLNQKRQHQDDPNQVNITTIFSALVDTEKDTIHSITKNSKGFLILNVHKDKLAHALTIGHKLMLAIKGETTPEEFNNIYRDPGAQLASLMDRVDSSNQANVPRAISASYATALIQHMEQDNCSQYSSGDETPKSTQTPIWGDANIQFPKPGGVSTNYSQRSENSSLKTQQTPKRWPPPDSKQPDSTMSPDSHTTLTKLAERLETLEMSYQNITKQLESHQYMLEENQKRSIQTDEMIRQFIGTFSTPLAKLLKIEENNDNEIHIVAQKPSQHSQPPMNQTNPKKDTTQHPDPGDNRAVSK